MTKRMAEDLTTYFTEAGRGTLCDIAVVGGALVISATDEPVPGGG